MSLTKAKVVVLMVVGVLTTVSPDILRILAAILLLIYIIRYREDESIMRMVAFVAVGYSMALFPSPWHAIASGVMLYLVYRRWEDAGFLGLLSGLSMVTGYMFYTFAEQKLGWLYGARLFYTDPATSLILGYGLFYTGVAVTAISIFLIFMKVAEEATETEVATERMIKRLAPKPREEEKKEQPEKKEVTAEEEKEAEKKEVATGEEEKKAVPAVIEEKKEEPEKKKVKARLPRSVEI